MQSRLGNAGRGPQLFHESLTEASIYDELLVARPPKRLIGGITVKF